MIFMYVIDIISIVDFYFLCSLFPMKYLSICIGRKLKLKQGQYCKTKPQLLLLQIKLCILIPWGSKSHVTLYSLHYLLSQNQSSAAEMLIYILQGFNLPSCKTLLLQNRKSKQKTLVSALSLGHENVWALLGLYFHLFKLRFIWFFRIISE